MPEAIANPTRDELLAHFHARDKSWNGRFIVAVTTTGIYCLPSCPARKPKPENTLLFPDEAAALLKGFRACKRCRPDHFYRNYDPDLAALEKLTGQIRESPADFRDVTDMVTGSGIGKTKLSACFREHFHETPANYLVRHRVLALADRIASSSRKPLELAYELGFESSSSFHDNFAKHLALGPSEYKQLCSGKPFQLKLPTDFDHARTLTLLGRDPHSLTEKLDRSRFSKALRLDGRESLIVIDIAKRSAKVKVESARPISPAGMVQAHRVAIRMLGLTCDPAPLTRLVRRTRGLSRLVRGREGLRVLLTADTYEALIWSIIGQQVNLSFAMAMRSRLVNLTAPRKRSTALDGLIPHPGPAAVAKLDVSDLRPLQFSERKAEYVIGISRSIHSGEIDLAQLAQLPATRVSEILLAQRGIGPWSANYVMMRGIGFSDSLPVGDSGIGASLKSFFQLDERPTAEETKSLMKPFRPYRSLACLHLWQRLSDQE